MPLVETIKKLNNSVANYIYGPPEDEDNQLQHSSLKIVFAYAVVIISLVIALSLYLYDLTKGSCVETKDTFIMFEHFDKMAMWLNGSYTNGHGPPIAAVENGGSFCIRQAGYMEFDHCSGPGCYVEQGNFITFKTCDIQMDIDKNGWKNVAPCDYLTRCEPERLNADGCGVDNYLIGSISCYEGINQDGNKIGVYDPNIAYRYGDGGLYTPYALKYDTVLCENWLVLASIASGYFTISKMLLVPIFAVLVKVIQCMTGPGKNYE